MSTRSRSRLALCALIALSPGVLAAPAAASGAWTPFGPAGILIDLLKTDPKAPGTVYLSSGVSLFKSTDDGRTWSESGSGLENNSLNTLATDPARPGTLYGLAGSDLFTSTNRGASWRRLSLPLRDGNPTRRELTVGRAGTLYAALDNNLFASSDRGGTWTLIFDAKLPTIQSVAVGPEASGALYVATGAVVGGVAIPAQIRKSDDGGLTWRGIAGDILPPDLGIRLGLGTLFLRVATTRPAAVYAGIYGQGIFKSTNGGASWRRLPLGEANPSFSLTALTVDPVDPATLYAAYGGTFRQPSHIAVSHDGGETWRSRERDLPPGYVTELAATPAGTLFAASPLGGVQVSTAGHPWRKLIRTSFEAPGSLSLTGKVRLHPDKPSTVYTLLDGQQWKSVDAGKTWTPFANGPGDPLLSDLAFDSTNPDLLYGAAPTGIFRSGDGGASWTALRGTAFSALALPRPGTILAGGCGIGRSTNHGATWRNVLPCHPQGPLSWRSIDKLWVHPTARNEVYATGIEYGQDPSFFAVYRSSDGGATWLRLLTGTHVLALDPTQPGTLYAAQGDNLVKSVNDGATWSPIGSFGLVFGEISDLVVDPASPSTLYAASESSFRNHLLRSRDGGRTWEPVTTPSSDFSITALFPHPTEPHLFRVAGGGGFYEVRLEP